MSTTGATGRSISGLPSLSSVLGGNRKQITGTRKCCPRHFLFFCFLLYSSLALKSKLFRLSSLQPRVWEIAGLGQTLALKEGLSFFLYLWYKIFIDAKMKTKYCTYYPIFLCKSKKTLLLTGSYIKSGQMIHKWVKDNKLFWASVYSRAISPFPRAAEEFIYLT